MKTFALQKSPITRMKRHVADWEKNICKPLLDRESRVEFIEENKRAHHAAMGGPEAPKGVM